MALSSTVVWEVQSGGNDANGGGFNSAAAGTDRSLATTPQVTIDGVNVIAAVHTTTTQINITGAVGYTVSAADVGNIINVTGGTGTAGHYQITAADVPNNRWTVDRAAGTAAQTLTGRMGGCKKSPGSVNAIIVNDNNVWIKGGSTYTFTTSTAGNDGPLLPANAVRVKYEAYTTTRGDKGIATVSAGAITGITMMAGAGSTATVHVEGVIFDGNSGASNIGVTVGTRWVVYNCEARNCTTGFSSSGFVVKSKASGCTTAGYTGSGICNECVATTCAIGFNGIYVTDCIAYANTGDGFTFSSGVGGSGCVAYGNSGDGFDVSSGTAGSLMVDCISTGNTGYQYNTASSANAAQRFINCAGKADGSGIFQATPLVNIGFVTLTVDPFNNAAGADFSINNTAGGGAALRATGISPFGQTSYRDIGANQHQDTTTGKPAFGIQSPLFKGAAA